MKLCIVLTTRGNYAKFKKIIALAEKDPQIDLKLVVGGELLLADRVSSLFNIKATENVYFNVGGDNIVAMAKSTGAAINEFCNAFNTLKPDMIMLVGDRFETFSAATAAYISSFPIAHLEGGEVSGSMDNCFRYLISEMSSIHFPCTKCAGEKLWARDLSPVHVVGSTSLDELASLPEIDDQDFWELQESYGSGNLVDIEKPFLLAVFHPDTTKGANVSQEINELIGAVDCLEIPTFWLNANLDAGSNRIGHELRKYRDTVKPSFIHFFKSLPIEYFGHLLKNASCIVGNSSAGIRESCFLGTPNVSIGQRQIGREIGKNTTFADPEKNLIKHLTIAQINHGRYEPDFLYGDGKASEKIMEVIRQ